MGSSMQFDVNGSRSVEGCLQQNKKPPMTAGSRVMDKLDPEEREELQKKMRELNATVSSMGKEVEALSSRLPKKSSRIRIGHDGNATLKRSQSSFQRKREREAKCRGNGKPNPNSAPRAAMAGSPTDRPLWIDPPSDDFSQQTSKYIEYVNSVFPREDIGVDGTKRTISFGVVPPN